MDHVLIIEDDEIDQFVVKRLLSRMFPEIELSFAFDGVEAIEWLEKNPTVPQAILLDIYMPRMNGLEFLAKYAPNHDGTIPVVIMLTSSDQARDKSEAMAYDFVSGYFEKPITEENVKELITYIERVSG